MTALRLLAFVSILLIAFVPVGAPVHAQEAPPAAVSEDPASAQPEQPQAPTSTSPGNPAPDRSGGLLGFLPDPREWAVRVFIQALVTVLNGINDAIRGVIGAVMGSSLNFVSQTPPAGSYDSPVVRSLWGVTRGIANAGLVLVALWGGFNLMVRQHLGQPYHEAMELFPRLALGALMVNLSLVWARFVIDVNNALCEAVGGASLPAWEAAGSGGQLLANVIAGLVYLVTGLVLLLQMLMRLALVDVLLVLSPLGLLCWVLPETQGWYRAWSSTFVAAVFTQFAQVVSLKLGGSLVSDLTPASKDTEALGLFLGVAVLAFTLKVPGLMRAHAGDGLGFVRYYAYRRGAQALGGGRGNGAATRAAGGATRAVGR